MIPIEFNVCLYGFVHHSENNKLPDVFEDFTGIKIQVSGFAVNKFEFFVIIYDFSRGFYKQIQRLFEPKTLIKVHSITVKNSSSSLTAICFSFE